MGRRAYWGHVASLVNHSSWPALDEKGQWLVQTGGGPRTYRNCGVKLQDMLFTPSQQCGSMRQAAQSSITMAICTGMAYLATRQAHDFLPGLSMSVLGFGSSGSGSAKGTASDLPAPSGFCWCGRISELELELVRRRGLRLLLKWWNLLFD